MITRNASSESGIVLRALLSSPDTRRTARGLSNILPMYDWFTGTGSHRKAKDEWKQSRVRTSAVGYGSMEILCDVDVTTVAIRNS